MQYFEYRGVSHGVYAEVLTDNAAGMTFGAVKEFVGLQEIGKTTESANEAHYYDNIPAIVISSTGADTLSLNTAGIPLDVLADITGQYYDSGTGMLVEQERTPKYFALGYVTQKTDGTKVLVWRLKGTFSVPEQTSTTQDAGTDANGQTLTYTGISSAHVFNANGKPARSVNVDTSANLLMTEQAFFTTVQTPDTIANAAATYTLDFDVDGGTAIATMTYPSGTYVTLPIPTKAGYDFAGWYADAGKTGDPIVAITMTANKTVYADWTAQ